MSATVEINKRDEWQRRLRLLLQEEAEAAHAVAEWAAEIQKHMPESVRRRNVALNRYVAARTERETFIAEISFP